jgi:putative endonuclease
MHRSELKFTVYIASSRSRNLYIGVTKDIVRRLYEHKHKLIPGYTERYNIDRLVYFDQFGDINEAILREKQLKSWLRSRKVTLIEEMNPNWNDLSDGWYLKE